MALITTSKAWCSCGKWLIGSEHSCDDCAESDWKAHNLCDHNDANLRKSGSDK